MRKKLKWGIISTAKIAMKRVVPAILQSNHLEVLAIGSSSEEKRNYWAQKYGIPKVHSSYDDLVNDPEIDIIYNPLPNHLHAEWTVKAASKGKHVLCEKPLGLSINEVKQIIAARNQFGVKIGEAFMTKTHPQWVKTKNIIASGELGDIKLINASFSYFNNDPSNIRNNPNYGGGAIWDIGCYPVTMSRYVLDEEPVRLIATIDLDPSFGVDIFASVIMEFKSGIRSNFTVGTQTSAYQRTHFLGTKKELEIQVPFNPAADRPCFLMINANDILQKNVIKIKIDACNQYTIQAEQFAKAILEDAPVPSSLEDALNNTKVLLAIFKSAKEKNWVEV